MERNKLWGDRKLHKLTFRYLNSTNHHWTNKLDHSVWLVLWFLAKETINLDCLCDWVMGIRRLAKSPPRRLSTYQKQIGHFVSDGWLTREIFYIQALEIYCGYSIIIFQKTSRCESMFIMWRSRKWGRMRGKRCIIEFLHTFNKRSIHKQFTYIFFVVL